MADDDQEPSTKREVPAKKAWMAPTAATTISPPAPPELALSVFDPPEQRFAETGELGRGGMGRVVEALDRALGRSVAIKQSLATSSTDLARFEREARITAQLQHPSVIPILDVGRDADGKPFYIMRKIEGEPLAKRVDEAATIRDRLALLPSLLGAIDAAAYAHARGIVHRDIKPWNILLGPFGETLLIDWGIARVLDEKDDDDDDDTIGSAATQQALTRFGRAYGTPGFLAPEQARGEPVDARADVYSLGATLFHLLTGKVPFGIDDPTAAIEKAASDQPPDFTAIPADVPQELRAIAIKALAAKPADRYADGGELAADVRRFLSGQLVAAHDYTARERIVKWVRRHRVAVTVSVLALIAIAIVSVVSIRRVIRDRDAAEVAKALAVDRADETLISRARSLAATDPTSAIAVLRGLRPDSPRWVEARTIVLAATRAGVERRIGTHKSHVTGLVFSPDGKWLASGSKGVAVHQLPSGATRTLSEVQVRELAWWGPRTLVYLTGIKPYTVGIIDVESGSSFVLPTTTPFAILPTEDRLLVVERIDERTPGRLVAFGRDREPTVLVDADVLDVGARGSRLVVVKPMQLLVIDPSETRTIDTTLTNFASTRLSQDGARVAVLGTGGLIREWTLANPAALIRSWQSPKGTLNNIEYVENTLLTWSANGSGFASLAGESPAALWTAREREPGVLTRHIYPFAGGAIFANDSGDLAIATARAASPLPHRPMGVTRVAVEQRGRWVAFGLGTGAVLLLDLQPVLPRRFPVSASAELVGITGDRTVMLDQLAPRPDPRPGALALRGVSMFDPDTGAVSTTGIESQAKYVFTRAGLIVGSVPASDHRWVWDTRGRLLFELDSPRPVEIKDGVVYWISTDHQIWSRATNPLGPPTLITRLPPGFAVKTAPGSQPTAIVIGFRMFDELMITARMKDRMHAYRVTSAGLDELALPAGEEVVPVGRLGGEWWFHDRAGEHLLRGTTKLALSHAVSSLRFLEDRAWAFGKDVVSEIDPGGNVLRELSVPESRSTWSTADSVLLADGDRIAEINAATNLRGTLHTLGKPETVAASADGKRIVALVTARDASRTLAYWDDTLPVDLGELRRFLDGLTNARLEVSSNALRWDD